LLDLARAKSAAFDPSAADLANEYFKTQTDLSTPENIEAIFQLAEDPFSEGFKFLIQNQPLFTTKYAQKALDLRIEEIFDTYLMRHPNLQLGEVQRLYASCYPAKGERLASSYRMTYHRQREDMARFAEAAIDHYKRYPTTDADELNEIAYLFWENVSSIEHLEKALEWADQSVKTQELPYNQETLARLYAKLGKKKAAEKAIRRAIQLAAANGEPTDTMQQFLKEIEH
jgi:tetratricopeptide (TPR) repeat protein